MQTGDTVRLNSGGPCMTVDYVLSYADHTKVACVWFAAEGTLQQAAFRKDCLKETATED